MDIAIVYRNIERLSQIKKMGNLSLILIQMTLINYIGFNINKQKEPSNNKLDLHQTKLINPPPALI